MERGQQELVQGVGMAWSAAGPWKREVKLPWREAGPPNPHDDKVDSDQSVVNKELSLWSAAGVWLGRMMPSSSVWCVVRREKGQAFRVLDVEF